jgi:hypothetical protein
MVANQSPRTFFVETLRCTNKWAHLYEGEMEMSVESSLDVGDILDLRDPTHADLLATFVVAQHFVRHLHCCSLSLCT